MKFSHRPMVVGLALATGLAGFGTVAALAGASDPPVVLSPTSGPVGTSITVTLPSACNVPKKPAGTTGEVDLSLVPVAGGLGYMARNYGVSVGHPVKVVTFPTAGSAPRGHYTLSGACYILRPKGYTFVTYGKAFFEVTGGKALRQMNVTPTSGPAGAVVKITGKCAPGRNQPSATFAVVLSSATDPNIEVSNQTSGAGPKLHTSVTIPATFPPGSYFVAASCFDYSHLKTFAEQPFTLTKPTRPSGLLVGAPRT